MIKQIGITKAEYCDRGHFIAKVSMVVSVTAFLAVFVLGCATLPKEADLKASLRSAAEEYWKMRVAGKYEETYKMEETTGLPPYEEYVKMLIGSKMIKYTASSIKDVHVEGTEGKVSFELSFLMPQIPKPFQQLSEEQWVYKGGKWLHIRTPVRTKPE